MKKLSHRDITSWLISIEMLSEVIKPDGKTAKYPTEHGEKIGISKETRIGVRGEYIVTVYNKTAQEFIVNNLDAVIEFKNVK